MKETNCDVIRDLLPLYEDNVVSEETAQMVREHLADCPQCREELRKMRTPISLPPEEDEDLWKKFAEKKARLRKKRNIRLACIALALAVFALFSLWYTRPVSTEQVMKGMPVENFTGVLDKAYVKDGIGGFDIWKLEDGLDADAPEYREMMDILGRAAYQSHLRNLLGPWYSDRSSYDWDGPTHVLLMFTDGQDRSITFSLDQKTLIVGRSWEERSYLYSLCNPQTILELDALFQKYGTANEK